MDLILVAVISLGAIGLIAAVILYAASKKFAVYEDPRIAKVSEVLPQANCGGCGYPGCSGFAGACVKAADAGSLEGKLCPVGGAPVMEKVAAILGLEAVAAEPKVAVVRCNGSCENRPRTALYDGAKSCAIAHATSGGETGCTFGCLGCGDCVEVCQFDAPILRMSLFSTPMLVLLFVLVFPTTISYLLLPLGLKYLKTTLVAIYGYLILIVATVTSFILGQDRFSWTQLAAIVLICASVYLVEVAESKSEKQIISKSR